MNIDVIIASPGEHSLISEIKNGITIHTDDINHSLSIIRQEHKKSAFSGIVGTDDSTVELATLAAKDLALIHNPPHAAKLTQRKDLARSCLTTNECSVPYHQLIDLSKDLEAQIENIDWPCVIKPLNMSASRGVIRVNNISDCLNACHRVAKIISDSENTFERNHLLLETYIDGREVAFEGYLKNGELHQLALFDKPNPLVGPYFEETIYVTPSQLEPIIQQHIKHRVKEACKAYGLITGPIHAELRIDENNEAWILEIANRSIGGDCGRTLDGAIEYYLEKLIICLAIGIEPPPFNNMKSQGVMMIPIHKAGILQKVDNVEAARKNACITNIKININSGNELIPLPEGNQYLGYIFAESNTPQQVVSALNAAYSELEFQISPKIDLLQG